MKGWFSRRESEEELCRRRAIARERALRKAAKVPEPEAAQPRRSEKEEAARLGAADDLTVGTLATGESVTVKLETLLTFAVVMGATGSGKTRFLLRIMMKLVRRMLREEAGLARELSLAVVDPKSETARLLALYLSALSLSLPDEQAERFCGMVRVVTVTSDAITPMPLVRDTGADSSSAFQAELTTDILVGASPLTFTDGQKTTLFMLLRALHDLGWPLTPLIAKAFLAGEAACLRSLSRVRDSDVREYFRDSATSIPRQTRDGLLRRLLWTFAIPEVRAALCLPLGVKRGALAAAARITIVDVGPDLCVPASKAQEIADYVLTDLLLTAPKRRAAAPLWVVLEEAATLFGGSLGSRKVIDQLTRAIRTLRSAGVGVLFSAQDLENALPPTLAYAIRANATWRAVFRSEEREAKWILPHLLEGDNAAGSDAKQRQDLLREIQVIDRQRFFLHVKGVPPLRLRALDTADPMELSGRTEDELMDHFTRHIAARSTVPTASALEQIARFEADVLGPPAPAAAGTPSTPPARNLRDLLDQFSADEAEADA